MVATTVARAGAVAGGGNRNGNVTGMARLGLDTTQAVCYTLLAFGEWAGRAIQRQTNMNPVYVTDYQLFSDDDLAAHAAAFEAECQAEEEGRAGE